MRVGLALEIDSTLDHLAPVVAEIDSALKGFFLERQYGGDVENIFIGVILMAPYSDRFHPVRKLKFKPVHKIRIPGHQIELKNVVEYDIEPDFDEFRRLSAEQARCRLASELLSSLNILEQHRVKFTNFDVAHFGKDLKKCLDLFVKDESFG